MIRKMLCVNQKERWTAQQLLQHPWITLGEDVLGQKEMTKQLETLKKYRAKMRFKKAVLAVTVGVKVRTMMFTPFSRPFLPSLPSILFRTSLPHLSPPPLSPTPLTPSLPSHGAPR